MAGLSDGTVRIWDVGDIRAPRPVGEPLRAPATQPVSAVALSPDGRTLATGNAVNQLRLWDVTDPARPRLGDAVLPGHRGLAFPPDGRVLAAGDLATDSVGLFDVSDPCARPRSAPPSSASRTRSSTP